MKLKNEIVQKLSIVSTSDKANKSIVEYMDITGKLPIIKNLSDNSQNRVLIFNNGCSRTCTGNPQNGTSGEWSYNKGSGTFACDGVAGPLVCEQANATSSENRRKNN